MKCLICMSMGRKLKVHDFFLNEKILNEKRQHFFITLMETFVFLKISHTHEGPDGTTHEFQKVPVKVLHTDQYYAVLERSIQLDPLEDYALDQAYKLNLALKQAAGGGAHAGHDHPH